MRVVARPGKPYAVQAEGEHGVAWIATSVQEYATLLGDTIGNSITLDVERIGDTLQIMRCLGNVKAVKTIEVDWQVMTEGGPPFVPMPGTEKEYPADLVFLALGFLGPEHPVADELGVKIKEGRGGMSWLDAEHERYTTSNAKVFVAGDCRRGQSLVVWAINEGRGAAREVDRFLMGTTDLP